jgi:hypothetical protein
VRVGDIPGYALMPRGGLCSTTVYYRTLAGGFDATLAVPSRRHNQPE